MADLAVSAASELVKLVIDWLKGPAAFVLFYEEKVKDLMNGVQELSNEHERVQHSLYHATFGVDHVERKVSEWIKKVEKAEKKADELLSKIDNTATTCLRIAPDPITRFRLGWKMASTMKTIKLLLGDTNKDNIYIFRADPPGKATGIGGPRQDDIPCGSKASTLINKIMEALMDDKINVIGIHGMGGIGKTTLVKEIRRQALQKEKFFNFVAMATVSDNPDLKKIQAVIAEQLGLKFNVDTQEVRAIELQTRLKKNYLEKAASRPIEQLGQKSNEELEDTRAEELTMRLKKNDPGKKVTLIILDDLWKGLDLEKIGIPRERGVKLLLTSRNQYVLSNEMGSQKNFPVEPLDDKASLKLLKKIVGEKVNDAQIKNVAIEVANKCLGLPILIKSLGMTLKNRDVHAWNSALEQLKISKDLYSKLELSYKNLEEEEAKPLFLLCSSIGLESISVKDLHRYGVGLGFFEGINMLGKSRDRLNSLIETLQACFLLQDSEYGDDSVTMHDSVRKLAIKIASREQNSLILTNGRDLLNEERLKKSKAISLPHASIEKLPEELICPELNILLLYAKEDDLKVPGNFFKGMGKLKVLDLANICFASLPPSIESLVNLRTLCLDYCSIGDMKMIGQLKNLQILSFIESKITCLPKEIGELTELRLLDLTSCSDLVTIEPNVLGSLTRLEELYLEDSFTRWQPEGEVEQNNARLSELNKMSHLNNIDILVPDASLLPEELPFKNLVKYRIHIGEWDWLEEYKESRTLMLKLDTRNLLLGEWIQVVMRGTQDLYLDGLEGLKRSVHELCIEGFQELKHLHVQNSSSIQYIVRSTEWLPFQAFPSLESLSLGNLINLEEICRGLLTEVSFCRLRHVKVESCNSLRSLFQLSLVRRLLQLEEIEVNDCKKLQAIVADAEDNYEGKEEKDDKCEMRNLRRLTLRSIPEVSTFVATKKELSSIHPGGISKITRGNEDENNPTIAFFGSPKVSIPNLESLTLAGISNMREIWYNQAPVGLGALKYLQVECCGNLHHIISSSLLYKFQNLESLTIEDCTLVEEIFNLEKLNQSENNEILPKLIELKLIKLPNLKCILTKNPQNVSTLQNMKRLKLELCDNLKYLFSSSTAKALVQLQRMEVAHCKSIERIIMKEENVQGREARDIIALGSLTFLSLKDLPNLLSFSHGNQYIECPALKKLKISNCHKMETFSSHSGHPDMMANDDHTMSFFNEKILLPMLEDLTLISMGSLKKIWKNQLSENCFMKVVAVTVKRCENLLAIFPSTLIKRLQHLERVSISQCNRLEVLFGPVLAESTEQGNSKIKRELLRLFELKEVKLDQLQNLTHIVKSDSLTVVGFPSLNYMSLRKCQNLLYAFPNTTARTLWKLERLEIFYCASMKEVVSREDVQVTDVEPMVFPFLHSMELCSLKSLISFSSGDCAFDFPSLKKLSIMWCDQVQAFIMPSISVSDATENDARSCPQAFFTDKVEFPSLEDLKVAGIPVKELWQHQLSREYFGKLKILKVKRCLQLLNVIPPFMFKRLQSLESLIVESCTALKYVYDLEGISVRRKEPTIIIQLTKLILIHLPHLVCIWNGDTPKLLSFKNLSSIRVTKVEDCGLEEIVAGGEKASTFIKFVFPQVTTLTLRQLPKLKKLSTRVHVTEWPQLKKMEIFELDSMDIFAYYYSNFTEALQQDTPIQWPLFFVDKDTFPNLVTLRLDWNNISKHIWDGQFQAQFFPQLRNLELRRFHHKYATFPSSFILNHEKLEKLVVCQSSFKEMFNLEAHSTEKGLARTPSLVKDLAISNHSETMHNQMGESVPCCTLSSLQILEVLECVNLINLMPSPICFWKLTSLNVSKCHSLKVLMSTSTARSLIQLSRLSISECDGLMEVLATCSREETDEIAFPQLNYLKLEHLKNITHFCTGSHNALKLPSLEKVIICQCPLLKFFSQGACSTPKLEKIWIKEHEEEDEDEDDDEDDEDDEEEEEEDEDEDEDEEDEEDEEEEEEEDEDEEEEEEEEDEDEEEEEDDDDDDEGEEEHGDWRKVDTLNATVHRLFIEKLGEVEKGVANETDEGK